MESITDNHSLQQIVSNKTSQGDINMSKIVCVISWWLFTSLVLTTNAQQYECDVTIYANTKPFSNISARIMNSTSSQELFQQLGRVIEYQPIGAEPSLFLVGFRAPGYLHYPADMAYRRLLQLSLSFDELYAAFTNSITCDNRLRVLLTARLCATAYPRQFTSRIRDRLLKEKDAEIKAIMLDAAIEAYCCLMSLMPSAKGKGVYEGCSDELFSCGRDLLSDRQVKTAMADCLPYLPEKRDLMMAYYAGERTNPRAPRDINELCSNICVVITMSHSFYTNSLHNLEALKQDGQ
jgi:hypothetical protein